MKIVNETDSSMMYSNAFAGEPAPDLDNGGITDTSLQISVEQSAPVLAPVVLSRPQPLARRDKSRNKQASTL